MELRNCGNTHFFQAIRDGAVIKVCNVGSGQKPALLLRTLKDVYESEDAKRLGRSSTDDLHIKRTGSVFYYNQVKSEPLCLPFIDRTLREIKPEFDEFALSGNDGSDLDDNTTLRQLTERSKTQKRKRGCSVGSISTQADANGKPAEDESDINEPLIIWKSKLKMKRANRKCTNRNVVTSLETSSSVNSEHNRLSEGSMHASAKLPQVIHVKIESPEPEPRGNQTATSSADNLSTALKEESELGVLSSNEISMECENRGAWFFAEECQNCVTNEVSYDHLEHVVPISMLLPSNGRTVKVEYQEMDSNEFLALPSSIIETDIDSLQELPKTNSPANIHSPYMCCTRSSSNMGEIPGQSSGNSSGQVPNTAVDSDIGCIESFNGVNFSLFEDNTKKDMLYEKDGPLSGPDKSCSSSSNSINSLEINDNSVPLKDAMVGGEENLIFNFDAVARNGLDSGNQLDGELSVNKETQTPISIGPYRDRKPSLESQSCAIANTLPKIELYQPPQRLLSTRKAISPSSQKRLCLNMKTVELCNEVDQYEYKGMPEVSSVRSDIMHTSVTENIEELTAESQRKVTINPRQKLKKSQNCGAPLSKGNLEGPPFSRTLANLSTGCTSTKGCSESAIAFSQRQMHDIETLAMKLMNELTFMKDIVEKKLLSEGCHNTSLGSDAEEVKIAIDNAKRVEETAKKWLLMMTRDCNRFCKIMKLTQDSVSASKNAIQRKRKKIVFADEAGGKLCHVKFFEDGMTSLSASDAELQG